MKVLELELWKPEACWSGHVLTKRDWFQCRLWRTMLMYWCMWFANGFPNSLTSWRLSTCTWWNRRPGKNHLANVSQVFLSTQVFKFMWLLDFVDLCGMPGLRFQGQAEIEDWPVHPSPGCAGHPFFCYPLLSKTWWSQTSSVSVALNSRKHAWFSNCQDRL